MINRSSDSKSPTGMTSKSSYTSNAPKKDRYDDLASLFLPDILHPLQPAASNSPSIKQEDLSNFPQNVFGDSPQNAFEESPPLIQPNYNELTNQQQPNNDARALNTLNSNQVPHPSASATNNFPNTYFPQHENFANNNNNNNLPMATNNLINHYANYIPIEATTQPQQQSHHLHHHSQHMYQFSHSFDYGQSFNQSQPLNGVAALPPTNNSFIPSDPQSMSNPNNLYGTMASTQPNWNVPLDRNNNSNSNLASDNNPEQIEEIQQYQQQQHQLQQQFQQQQRQLQQQFQQSLQQNYPDRHSSMPTESTSSSMSPSVQSQVPSQNQSQPVSTPPVTASTTSTEVTATATTKPANVQPSRERRNKSTKPAKKAKVRPSPSPDILIDYKLPKLTSLLDMQPAPRRPGTDNNYKIIDSASNNEIDISLSGFVNGKFFTNDVDNTNFLSINQESGQHHDDTSAAKRKVRMDPKVISCYRRNFIQLSLNLNLSNFSNANSKVLKLQTTEYGYIITRVIKWLKVEVCARSVSSNPKSVPIIITDDEPTNSLNNSASNAKRDKELSEDHINPESVTSSVHIIPINKTEIDPVKLAVDNYYTIRKLQFKSATPHNGNFTFQNYYHLKVKLSAVVADMYYDDYISDDLVSGGRAGSQGPGGNLAADPNTNDNPSKSGGGDAGGSHGANDYDDKNEITLCELVSKPIIVRGRNPSFYFERKDILIKGRVAQSKKSFGDAVEATSASATASAVAAAAAANTGDASGTGGDAEIDEDDYDGDMLVDERGRSRGPFNQEGSEDQEDLSSNGSVNNESSEPSSKRPSGGSFSSMTATRGPQSMPPLMYNAMSSKGINLKSMLSNGTDSSAGGAPLVNLNNNNLVNTSVSTQGVYTPSSEGGKTKSSNYKYFPISNVYYLPPINVVYFPHRAHQHRLQNDTGLITDARAEGSGGSAGGSDEASAKVSEIRDAEEGNQENAGAASAVEVESATPDDSRSKSSGRRKSSNVYFR